MVSSKRITKANFLNISGEGVMTIQDDYATSGCSYRSLRYRWTGETEFALADASRPAAPLAHEPRLAILSSWKGLKRVLIEFCTYDDPRD